MDTTLRVALALLAAALISGPAAAADESDKAWTALAEGGHVALIRHGNAPPGYGGDPPGFRIDDCSTQRNLDDKGREQGRALGEAFRKHGVHVDQIRASPVCRCLETARLMAVGTVETTWALVPDRDPTTLIRLRDLREMISSWKGPGTLVLVTLGLTIRPLTGTVPEQAATVVFKPTPGIGSGARLVGKIEPPR